MKKITCLNCGTTFEISMNMVGKDELGWHVGAGSCPGCDSSFDIDLKDIVDTQESNSDAVTEDLYNGRIYPAEDCAPHTEEYRRATKDHANCEALLRDLLDAEHQPVVDLLIDAHHTVIDQTGLAFFREGLRLGARLALALLHDDTPEQAPDTED